MKLCMLTFLTVFFPLKVETISIEQYRTNPKILDTQKFAVITLKVEQDGFSLE